MKIFGTFMTIFRSNLSIFISENCMACEKICKRSSTILSVPKKCQGSYYMYICGKYIQLIISSILSRRVSLRISWPSVCSPFTYVITNDFILSLPITKMTPSFASITRSCAGSIFAIARKKQSVFIENVHNCQIGVV